MANSSSFTGEEYSVFHKRTVYFIFIASLCGALGPLAANIFLPSIDVFVQVFNTSKQGVNGTISMFMLILAFAPLMLSLWSDKYGRRPVLLSSLFVYMVSNILISALPPSIVALYLLRVFQGIGAANLAVGVGVIADISEPKNRAKAISYYMIGPQLGPVVGPILGMVGASFSWRWNFIILAILGFISLTLIFVFLPETSRAIVGNGWSSVSGIFVPFTKKATEIEEPNMQDVVESQESQDVEEATQKKPVTAQKRPGFVLYLKLCLNRPVLLCSFSGGLAFSCFYALTVSYSEVLTDVYDFPILHVCLAYIAPGIALVVGSIIFGIISDNLRNKTSSKYGMESRFKLQISCLVPFVVSVVGWGWVAQTHGHVAYLVLLIFFVAFFVSGILITNTTYLSELSRNQPASYVAFGNLIRNLGAAMFVACISPLTGSVGYGWAFTIFSSSCIISLVLSVLVLIRGHIWRQGAVAETETRSEYLSAS